MKDTFDLEILLPGGATVTKSGLDMFSYNALRKALLENPNFSDVETVYPVSIPAELDEGGYDSPSMDRARLATILMSGTGDVTHDKITAVFICDKDLQKRHKIKLKDSGSSFGCSGMKGDRIRKGNRFLAAKCATCPAFKKSLLDVGINPSR